MAYPAATASLSAVSVTKTAGSGTGSSLTNAQIVYTSHSATFTVTSFTATAGAYLQCTLQGSLDGSNWFVIAAANVQGNAASVLLAPRTVYGQLLSMPSAYLRCVAVWEGYGSTSPTATVTATCGSTTTTGATDGIPVLNVMLNGAKGDGTTDDTAAIQATINLANTDGMGVFFPYAQYRFSTLTLGTSSLLYGVTAGSYGGASEDALSGQSCLERIASTNEHGIVLPDGNNYCRIYDLEIDGNKNNNTAGDGIHIADGASGQECQAIIQRCFIHDNPGSNIYLGNNRRANKVLDSVCNYAVADGITVAGSDNTVRGNICGTNGAAGINLGTTIGLRWAARSTPFSAAVSHVSDNDVYGNLVGINVSSGSWGSMIYHNGIDRNLDEGIAVYDGTSTTLSGNALHSNGQNATNTYPHIGLGANVVSADITGNVFAQLDSGVTNVPSYGVSAAGTTTKVNGDLGVIDSTSTVGGLVFAKTGVWVQTTGALTGSWSAPDQGLIAWSFDIIAAENSSPLGAQGLLYLTRVHVPIACAVTNVLIHVSTLGATLTSGENFAGLWSATGTQIGITADQSTNWSTTTGIQVMALAGGAKTITAGDYFVGFYANGTTLPTLTRGQSAGGSPGAVNLGSSTLRFATANTGLLTTPPTTLGALTGTNFSFWAAVS